MEGRLYKQVAITLEAFTPLLVGGREPDRFVHISTSTEGDFFIIPASAMKGAVVERLKNMSSAFFSSWLGTEEGIAEEEHFQEGVLKFTDMHSMKQGIAYDERTRVTINRRTHTSEAGHLFQLSAAPRGTKFQGYLYFKKDISQQEFQSFTRALSTFPLFIGGSQTSGFGKAIISFGTLEDIPTHNINQGLWRVSMIPLSPYSSKPISGTVEKSYVVPTKDYIDATSITKVCNCTRASFFYPSDSFSIPGFPVPMTYFVEKNSVNQEPIDLIKELVYGREKQQPFLLSAKDTGHRLIPMKGYMGILDDKKQLVNTQTLASFHLNRNEKTKTVDQFWVQASLKPAAFSGHIYSEKGDLKIPEIVQLGGSRGKGYGLCRVQVGNEYREWDDRWSKNIDACTKFIHEEVLSQSNGNSLFIPILITTPTVLDSAFFNDYDIFSEFSRTKILRKYNPQTGKTELITALAPGSVLILQPKKSEVPSGDSVAKAFDATLNSMKARKKIGLGDTSQAGFGDFEVYPWR